MSIRFKNALSRSNHSGHATFNELCAFEDNNLSSRYYSLMLCSIDMPTIRKYKISLLPCNIIWRAFELLPVVIVTYYCIFYLGGEGRGVEGSGGEGRGGEGRGGEGRGGEGRGGEGRGGEGRGGEGRGGEGRGGEGRGGRGGEGEGRGGGGEGEGRGRGGEGRRDDCYTYYNRYVQ